MKDFNDPRRYGRLNGAPASPDLMAQILGVPSPKRVSPTNPDLIGHLLGARYPKPIAPKKPDLLAHLIGPPHPKLAAPKKPDLLAHLIGPPHPKLAAPKRPEFMAHLLGASRPKPLAPKPYGRPLVSRLKQGPRKLSPIKTTAPLRPRPLGLRLPNKKVFVSFDYDNDKQYKFMLEAWNNNPHFHFVFFDATPREINSNNVGRVKAALTLKIASATHTLVIVGKEANKLHKDHKLIGFRNWINFEVAKSKELKKKLLAVKIDRSYTSPYALIGANASLAMSFKQDQIIQALLEAG